MTSWPPTTRSERLSWMADLPVAKAPPSFLAAIVASVARHILTTAAGGLVTFGVFQATQTSEFVDLGLSVVAWGFAIWWSSIQKKNIVAVAT